MTSHRVEVAIEFSLEKRRNVYAKNGEEWALNANLNNGSRWTLATWDKEPSEDTVDSARWIALQSIKFWNSRPRIAEVPTTV